MVTRYFRLAVAAISCLLPARVKAADTEERVEATLPWADHGSHLQFQANAFDSRSKNPAAPHSLMRKCSPHFLETLGVVVAATTVLFLVFRWSSSRRKKAISQRTVEDGSPLPSPEFEPFELHTDDGVEATDDEFRSASVEDEEGDVVELQIGILTLNADDASTLSPAERRMVALALESIQVVGDELEVLHAKAAEVDRQLADLREEIEEVSETEEASADYPYNAIEALQAAVERLEEQSESAWEMYGEKNQQRLQMGYATAQEQRSARLLSDSASRRSSDGAPPLTPRAAAAVAAAERVLHVLRLHSPLPAPSRPFPLSERAGKVEKSVRVHTMALSQALQSWNDDRAALVAAAEEALGEATTVAGQLAASNMNDASRSLESAIDSLRMLLQTANNVSPSIQYIRSMIEQGREPATGAVARVQEQKMLALRVSRDLGKMLRSMDGTEAHYRKMEVMFGDGVAIFTVATHTEVPQEVPHDVYHPFQLALQMCERILMNAADVLHPYWRAKIIGKKQQLLNAAEALRMTRAQAAASGVTGVFELLERDMRCCRTSLNEAKAMYQSMMALTAFKPVLPILTNVCVELKVAMDGAQTQLVQAADTLASAWEAELKEAIEAFKLHAEDDDARQLSLRADDGDDALARIYYLADPSPQFEGLEEALDEARLLIAEFQQEQQQQQKTDKQQQGSTTSAGALSRLKKWLKQTPSGHK